MNPTHVYISMWVKYIMCKRAHWCFLFCKINTRQTEWWSLTGKQNSQIASGRIPNVSDNSLSAGKRLLMAGLKLKTTAGNNYNTNNKNQRYSATEMQAGQTYVAQLRGRFVLWKVVLCRKAHRKCVYEFHASVVWNILVKKCCFNLNVAQLNEKFFFGS